MGGLYFEYVVEYLNEKDVEVHKAKAPQQPHELFVSLKDLMKKLAKPKQ